MAFYLACRLFDEYKFFNQLVLFAALIIYTRLIMQLLLERGASLEAKDEDGAIPLHDACAGGRALTSYIIFSYHACDLILKRALDQNIYMLITHFVLQVTLILPNCLLTVPLIRNA